jgi:methylenetetrahydrofolate reductase (NADPH)
MNLNGLESEAWLLNSEGFHNILAMTGDYPIAGNDGLAKPVFDIDSVGLISMLSKMNGGFDWKSDRASSQTQRLEKTQFCIGAVTTNFKLFEGEVMPQYAKLEKKLGAARSSSSTRSASIRAKFPSYVFTWTRMG